MVELVLMRVSPDDLISAAQRLAIIELDIGAVNVGASASTNQVAVAARDEISEGIAALFSTYA